MKKGRLPSLTDYSPSRPLRIGVLISGGGSNLQALIDLCQNSSIAAEVVLVLSNVETAYGLERAQKSGIPTLVIDHSRFEGREAFDRAMIDGLDKAGVDLVCLAGFMRLLTPTFVGHYAQRLINIHPALLPSFPGLHVQQKALDAGVRFSGATVHFVDEGMDTGPIIAQAVVPILPGDDANALGARILKQEHRIYPLVVALFARNRVRLEGGRVEIVDGGQEPDAALLNPPMPSP
ncbi:MAG: phosphoribosylglycinamide formyltransferase [Magnetococcales bacterium]|nr:phosphoribosylglycinamide formyltransferase [Magnetococcales bacterium]